MGMQLQPHVNWQYVQDLLDIEDLDLEALPPAFGSSFVSFGKGRTAALSASRPPDDFQGDQRQCIGMRQQLHLKEPGHSTFIRRSEYDNTMATGDERENHARPATKCPIRQCQTMPERRHNRSLHENVRQLQKKGFEGDRSSQVHRGKTLHRSLLRGSSDKGLKFSAEVKNSGWNASDRGVGLGGAENPETLIYPDFCTRTQFTLIRAAPRVPSGRGLPWEGVPEHQDDLPACTAPVIFGDFPEHVDCVVTQLQTSGLFGFNSVANFARHLAEQCGQLLVAKNDIAGQVLAIHRSGKYAETEKVLTALRKLRHNYDFAVVSKCRMSLAQIPEAVLQEACRWYIAVRLIQSGKYVPIGSGHLDQLAHSDLVTASVPNSSDCTDPDCRVDCLTLEPDVYHISIQPHGKMFRLMATCEIRFHLQRATRLLPAALAVERSSCPVPPRRVFCLPRMQAGVISVRAPERLPNLEAYWRHNHGYHVLLAPVMPLVAVSFGRADRLFSYPLSHVFRERLRPLMFSTWQRRDELLQLINEDITQPVLGFLCHPVDRWQLRHPDARTHRKRASPDLAISTGDTQKAQLVNLLQHR